MLGLGEIYDYRARWYDPALLRFTAADTFLGDGNRYAYAHNNPINVTDPTGHWGDPPGGSTKPWALTGGYFSALGGELSRLAGAAANWLGQRTLGTGLATSLSGTRYRNWAQLWNDATSETGVLSAPFLELNALSAGRVGSQRATSESRQLDRGSRELHWKGKVEVGEHIDDVGDPAFALSDTPVVIRGHTVDDDMVSGSPGDWAYPGAFSDTFIDGTEALRPGGLAAYRGRPLVLDAHGGRNGTVALAGREMSARELAAGLRSAGWDGPEICLAVCYSGGGTARGIVPLAPALSSELGGMPVWGGIGQLRVAQTFDRWTSGVWY